VRVALLGDDRWALALMAPRFVKIDVEGLESGAAVRAEPSCGSRRRAG
jgi:hypothetical protein